MPETPEERRARLTLASRKAASVRTEAAISRYLAKLEDHQLIDAVRARGYIVIHRKHTEVK